MPLSKAPSKKNPFSAIVLTGCRDVHNGETRFFHPGKTTPTILRVPDDVSYGNFAIHKSAGRMDYISESELVGLAPKKPTPTVQHSKG